jgi:prolyl-tRNA synthetase
MPDGRTLQVASCHHYQDQWAQAFDMNYEAADGSRQNCHQTTYGMSERLLGSVVGMHGDDSGLIFPPKIAPIQVVLIPVAAHKDEAVMTSVTDVANQLRSNGYRVHIDDRDLRPGQKYYDWEIKGVPLRLDIGPRDIESGTAFAARRTGGKQPIPLASIIDAVGMELDAIGAELLARSSAHSESCIQPLTDLQTEFEDGKIYEIAFDGNDADAEVLEKTTGLTLLGDHIEPFTEPRPCIVSGKMTTRRQHLARMF